MAKTTATTASVRRHRIERAAQLRPISVTNYARYIGRVGALAVALGIGVAMATGQGMGMARADDSPPADPPSAPSDPSPGTPPAGTSGDLDTPTPPSDTPTPTTASGAPPSAPTHTPSVPDMNFDSSGGAHTSGGNDDASAPSADTTTPPTPEATTVPAVTELPATAAPVTTQTPVAPPKSPKKTTSTPAAQPSATAKVESSTTPPAAGASDTARATTTVTVVGEPTQARLAPAANGAQVAATESPQTPTASTMQVSAFTAPPPSTATPGVVDVASTVLTAVLAPSALPGPGAPPDSPALLAALAWARRETQREIGNTTPDVTPQETTLALATVSAPLALTTAAPAAKAQPAGKKPPTNTAPVANADSYTTTRGTPLTVAGPGVLANDTDADGNPLTAVLAGKPANGTLALNPDGSFTYTPNATFTGTDTFSYKASDGTDTTKNAKVTITVVLNRPPVAGNDSYSTSEDTPLTIAGPGVLTNDSDPDANPLTAALVSQPAHGTVFFRNNGSFTYTPAADYNGADSFTYRVNDGAVNSNTATVAITVAAINDFPDAFTTTALTNAQTGEITVNVVIRDPEHDPFTVTVSQPTHGTGTVSPLSAPVYDPTQDTYTYTFTYTPHLQARLDAYTTPMDPDIDIVTVTATDGIDDESETVAVTISPLANAAPNAADDSASTSEDTAVSGNVLTNDSDPQGSSLTAALVSGPSHAAQFTLNPDGSFSYTPAADYNGPDSFTYKANDGALDSTTATVHLTVNPVNDRPTANPDSYSTAEDTELVVPAGTGILANDTDAEGSALTAAVVTPPAHGTVTLNATGGFAYAPAADYNGPDSFTYKANDGTLDSNTANVSITVTPVNDAPTDGRASVEQPLSNGQVNGSVTASDADQDTLKFIGSVMTSKGTVIVNNTTGTFTYTPTPEARHKAAATNATDTDKQDTFTVTVVDSHGGTLEVPVTVAIRPANTNPTGQPQTFGNPDSTGVVTGIVTASDADNDTLTFSAASNPTKGGVVVNDNGTFTYTPTDAARHNAALVNASDFFKYDQFNVRVDDGHGGFRTVTVTVEIGPKNAPPTASPTPGTTHAVTGANSGSVGATDPDSDGLSYTVTEDPEHGTATVVGGTYTYTPTAVARLQAYVSPTPLTDTFTVRVNDGHGATIDVPITVEIDPSAYVLTAAGIPGFTFNDYPFDSGNVQVSPDGSHAFAQTYTFESANKWMVRLSVVNAGGTVSTSPAAQHFVRPRGFVMSPDGTRAYTTTNQYDSATSTFHTTLTVMNADGSSAALPIDGSSSVYLVNARTYLLTSTNDDTTIVSVLNSDNTHTVLTNLQGSNAHITVTPDGTRAYITTYTGSTNPVTSVAVIRPDNTVGTLTTSVGASPNGAPVVSPAGDRAYQVTYTSNGQGGQYQTTVLAINSDDTVTALPTIAGFPGGIVFSEDGSRAYYLNSSTQLFTINPNNTITNGPTFGGDTIERAVSADGRYVYVMTYKFDSARVGWDYRVSVVGPTGTVTQLGSYAFRPGSVGQSAISGLTISPDGTRVYITSVTPNPALTSNIYTLTVVDGAARTLTQIDVPGPFLGNSRSPNFYTSGSGGLTVTSDNRAYLTFRDSQYSMLVVNPDLTSTIVRLPGSPDNGGLIASPDGTKIYLTTGTSDSTTVWVVESDGTLTKLATVAGAQADAMTFSADGMRLYLVTLTVTFPVSAVVNTIYIPPAAPSAA